MRSATWKTSWSRLADQNHRYTPVAQATDQIEHSAHLLERQAGGGFIHNHQLGVEADGASNGDGLPLPPDSFSIGRSSCLIWICRCSRMVAVSRFMRGQSSILRRPNDNLNLFASQEKVGRDIPLGHIAQVLIDHLDAEVARVLGAADVDLAAVKMYAARSAL